MKIGKLIKSILKVIAALIAAIILFAVIFDLVVIIEGANLIKSQDNFTSELSNSPQIDAIVVLGCGVRNHAPTPMLEDRLKTASDAYFTIKNEYETAGKPLPKIILTGDQSEERSYDEVSIMKKWMVEEYGVPEDALVLHGGGYSTYESIHMVSEMDGIQNVVIVTQKYHLYRATYLAKSLGLGTVGLSADKRKYAGQFMRELREFIARDKDFLTGLFQPSEDRIGTIL